MYVEVLVGSFPDAGSIPAASTKKPKAAPEKGGFYLLLEALFSPYKHSADFCFVC